VQLGHLAGVFLAECAASVGQHPQHGELVVSDHRTQPGHPGPDQRHAVGVGGVGLASLAGREHPRACRQLRRHIDDLLVLGQQPHRDVPADPAAPLDRPDTIRPLLHLLDQRPKAGDVGAEPAAADHGFVDGHHLDGHRPFVRVHPDHDPLTPCQLQPLQSDPVGRVETAPLLPAEQSLLEPLRPSGDRDHAGHE